MQVEGPTRDFSRAMLKSNFKFKLEQFRISLHTAKAFERKEYYQKAGREPRFKRYILPIYWVGQEAFGFLVPSRNGSRR